MPDPAHIPLPERGMFVVCVDAEKYDIAVGALRMSTGGYLPTEGHDQKPLQEPRDPGHLWIVMDQLTLELEQPTAQQENDKLLNVCIPCFKDVRRGCEVFLCRHGLFGCVEGHTNAHFNVAALLPDDFLRPYKKYLDEPEELPYWVTEDDGSLALFRQKYVGAWRNNKAAFKMLRQAFNGAAGRSVREKPVATASQVLEPTEGEPPTKKSQPDLPLFSEEERPGSEPDNDQA